MEYVMSNQSLESALSVGSLVRSVAETQEMKSTLGFYKLINEIGHGSFSHVYEAIDTRNGNRVAVKLFNSEFSGDGFVREVGLGMGLSHPNLLSVIDLGYAPDKKRYVVYRLALGDSLRPKMKQRGISRGFIGNYITQISRGLSVLHAKSVVHRDLKPENMLFDSKSPFSLLRLIDWGTAEIVNKQQAKGEMGSPAYMSPEQINGSCDTRADIYSVGVIAYELLFGRRPFTGAPIDVLRGHLKETPDFTGISDEMETVLRKALAKLSGERYQTIEDFYFEFEAALFGNKFDFDKNFVTNKGKKQSEIAVDDFSGWSVNRNGNSVGFEGDNAPNAEFEVVGRAKAVLSGASLIQFAVRDDVNFFYGFQDKVFEVKSPLYGMPPVAAIRKFNGDVWTINGASNPTLSGRNYSGELVKEIRLSQSLSDIFSFNSQKREKLLGIDLNRKNLFLFDVDETGNNFKTAKLGVEIRAVSVAEEKIMVETIKGTKHFVQDEFI
jgi:serine/threonine protein kinase